MAENDSTQEHDATDGAIEYFDRPAYMRQELTEDLLQAGYGAHFGQAERLGDVAEGLNCISGLLRLAQIFQVQEENDELGDRLSPNMKSTLLSSIELLAKGLESEIFAFGRQLAKDVQLGRVAQPGADFDARR